MKPSIVLVETKYEQNIGACARAMANMGGSQLILINPHCQINVESYKAAAGAQKYLDKLQSFHGWEDYLKFYPHPLRIAFTARSGKERKTQSWIKAIPDLMPSQNPWHFVFGPEDNGLSEIDLLHCNLPVSLSTYGDFKSLNLAQAVLIALSQYHQFYSSKNTFQEEADEFAQIDEGLLKEYLLQLGFSLESPRSNAFLRLKKYFNKHLPTSKEKALIEKVFQQSLRKIKANKL
ncbi:MAG: RNA methyltransferase [Bdellovibrionales bacterium]|nr:RNA methyltransferase [Bdellovibrionales bacterium]